MWRGLGRGFQSVLKKISDRRNAKRPFRKMSDAELRQRSEDVKAETQDIRNALQLSNKAAELKAQFGKERDSQKKSEIGIALIETRRKILKQHETELSIVESKLLNLSPNANVGEFLDKKKELERGINYEKREIRLTQLYLQQSDIEFLEGD